jgi:hypothetical protein
MKLQSLSVAPRLLRPAFGPTLKFHKGEAFLPNKKEESMIPRISMAMICASMLIIFGCDSGTTLPPPTQPPSGMPEVSSRAAAATPTSLSASQIAAVFNFQKIIEFEGAQFTRFKEDTLNQCLDQVLELQLRFENGQLDAAHYNAQLSQTRSECAQQFHAIGVASTGLVNNIVAACRPVQSLILPYSGYDPLELGALVRSEGFTLVADATGLAGSICGAKELFVDALVSNQMPRMAGLLKILDNGTGQFAVPGPTSAAFGIGVTTIPNIPLDSRCIFPSLPG